MQTQEVCFKDVCEVLRVRMVLIVMKNIVNLDWWMYLSIVVEFINSNRINKLKIFKHYSLFTIVSFLIIIFEVDCNI